MTLGRLRWWPNRVETLVTDSVVPPQDAPQDLPQTPSTASAETATEPTALLFARGFRATRRQRACLIAQIVLVTLLLTRWLWASAGGLWWAGWGVVVLQAAIFAPVVWGYFWAQTLPRRRPGRSRPFFAYPVWAGVGLLPLVAAGWAAFYQLGHSHGFWVVGGVPVEVVLLAACAGASLAWGVRMEQGVMVTSGTLELARP